MSTAIKYTMNHSYKVNASADIADLMYDINAADDLSDSQKHALCHSLKEAYAKGFDRALDFSRQQVDELKSKIFGRFKIISDDFK